MRCQGFLGLLSAALSLAGPLPPACAQISLSTIRRSDETTERRILQALDQPVSLEAQDLPISAAIERLVAPAGIKLWIAHRELTDAGIDANQPVTFSCRNVSRRAALNRLLAELGLGWNIVDEGLLITSKERCDEMLTVRVYPVRDLAESYASDLSPNLGELVNAIVWAIEPTSWDENGGPGSLQGNAAAGALICSQTRAAHEQIEGLLRALRQARSLQQLDDIPPLDELAVERSPNLPAPAAVPSRALRTYVRAPAMPLPRHLR